MEMKEFAEEMGANLRNMNKDNSFDDDDLQELQDEVYEQSISEESDIEVDFKSKKAKFSSHNFRRLSINDVSTDYQISKEL